MKLLQIELTNFRQFYGVQSLQFSTDPDKRVTLIHAENGVGKTAFLNAILWCFFDMTTDNFSQPNNLINKVAKSEGRSNYGVIIDFEHRGETYSAHRRFIVGNTKFRVYHRAQAGDDREIENPEHFINTVVPKAMAPYFFFQGEGVGSFASGRHGKVREAIERILGFTVAQKAVEDLKTITSQKRREFKNLDNEDDVAKIQNALAEAEEQLDKKLKDESRLSEQVDELSERIESIDQQYRDSNSETVKEREKRRKSLETQLINLDDHIDTALKRKTNLVTDFAASVFSKKLVDEGVPYLEDKELEGKLPAPHNEHVVTEILKKHECICGNEIHPGTEAHRRITMLLDQAADPALQKRVSKARSMLTKMENDQQRVLKYFKESIEEVGKFERHKDGILLELQSISAQLEGADLEDIADMERNRKQLAKQLSESQRRLGANEAQIRQLRSLLTDLKEKESRLEASSPAAKQVKKELQICELLAERIDNMLTETREKSLNTVRHKVNGFIERFVRQDYKAGISNDYQLELLDRNNDVVPKSDGQNLLLSLTFISALISLARERASADGVILEPGALAPFVVDAPFGVLDNEYKANIAREIPDSVDQVVFLLSSSHWEGAVEKEIRTKVGREYIFTLHDIGDVKEDIKQSIEINNKHYPNVVYDAERDMTEIVEVA